MGERANVKTSRRPAWRSWGHPPFHYFGLLPFLFGTILAWHLEHRFSLAVLLLSLGGIALVMFSTHAIAADRELTLGPAHLPQVRRPDASPPGLKDLLDAASPLLKIGIGALALATLAASALQILFYAGPLTFLLGGLGALPGLCYASRACRWLDRGLGEALASVCYSWLPMAAGFYVQTGTLAAGIHGMAMPIGLTLLNVILIHEYTDGPVTVASGKGNLLALVGKTGGMVLHVASAILTWCWMVGLIHSGVPIKSLYLYLPVMVLSMVATVMMARRKYESPFSREWLVGLNIAVHLGTTLALLLAYV